MIAFLDDTKSPEDGWFGLGGLILDGTDLMRLEASFETILKNAGVPVDDESIDTEVKWSPGKNNWIRQNLKGDKRVKLYRTMLNACGELESVLVAAVFNYGIITGWDDSRARDEAFVHVFERIQAYAQHKRAIALIICDLEEDPKKTKERIKHTFELVRAGSKYKGLGNIYKHVWAVDSKYHAGCQIADLVVGITGCMVSGKTQWASRYWDLFRGWFFQIPLDEPQKYGLSILPTPTRKRFIEEYDPYGWHRQCAD